MMDEKEQLRSYRIERVKSGDESADVWCRAEIPGRRRLFRQGDTA